MSKVAALKLTIHLQQRARSMNNTATVKVKVAATTTKKTLVVITANDSDQSLWRWDIHGGSSTAKRKTTVATEKSVAVTTARGSPRTCSGRSMSFLTLL